MHHNDPVSAGYVPREDDSKKSVLDIRWRARDHDDTRGATEGAGAVLAPDSCGNFRCNRDTAVYWPLVQNERQKVGGGQLDWSGDSNDHIGIERSAHGLWSWCAWSMHVAVPKTDASRTLVELLFSHCSAAILSYMDLSDVFIKT